jgi:hypothetical protein
MEPIVWRGVLISFRTQLERFAVKADIHKGIRQNWPRKNIQLLSLPSLLLSAHHHKYPLVAILKPNGERY